MANDDWAIVVGIKSYFDPALAGLEGTETDAKEFYDWVVSDDGGAVPPGQAKLILSSDYNPPFKSSESAMPTAEAIKLAFDHLRTIADENEKKGLSRWVGNRLYVFLSGHGFAPAQRDDLTALLTADASLANAQLSHILGSYMADFFWRAKFYDEILLFMDCCRSVMDCAQLYTPYDDERASDFYKVRRFYAYGARVGKESREWKMSDGQFHGVFTKTLLDALKGAAYDSSDPSIITAESLRDQLYNGFKAFMSPPDQQRLDLPKEPEVDYEEKPGANFTIVTRVNLAQRILGLTNIPKYSVTISPSGTRVGRRATIRDKDFNVVSEQTLTGSISVLLQRGFYTIQIAETAEPFVFEVASGVKEIHV